MTSNSELAVFAQHLFLDGQMLLGSWRPPAERDIVACHEHILRAHETAALDAPDQSPELDLDAASWATVTLHWGACMFVDRAATATRLPSQLQASEPVGSTACHHWSVDIAFRFLPSLIRRSQRIANDDQLTQTLYDLAMRWPMSAVGVEPVSNNINDEEPSLIPDANKLSVIASHPCLHGVLIDRVMRQKCQRLANHVLFRDSILRAIGPYKELARWLTVETETTQKEE